MTSIILKPRKGGQINLSYADFRKITLLIRAINHKLRLSIVELLLENDKMTVTDIYIKLRLEQSVASQHLAIMRRAGIVVTQRKGKFIRYSLDKDALKEVLKLTLELCKAQLKHFNKKDVSEYSTKVVIKTIDDLKQYVEDIKKAALIVRAFTHQLRLKIMEWIDQRALKKSKVGPIYQSNGWEQSSTSQQLRIGRLQGVYDTERDGKFISYSLNYPFIRAVANIVSDYLAEPDNSEK